MGLRFKQRYTWKTIIEEYSARWVILSNVLHKDGNIVSGILEEIVQKEDIMN